MHMKQETNRKRALKRIPLIVSFGVAYIRYQLVEKKKWEKAEKARKHIDNISENEELQVAQNRL